MKSRTLFCISLLLVFLANEAMLMGQSTIWEKGRQGMGILTYTQGGVDNYLAVMTDQGVLTLWDKDNRFIPVQTPLKLSGKEIQMDSIYYFSRGEDGEYTFAQKFRGAPIVQLKGYFVNMPMGPDDSGVPFPGVYLAFVPEEYFGGERYKDWYAVRGFDQEGVMLGGKINISEQFRDRELFLYTLLFVDQGETGSVSHNKHLLHPYRLIALEKKPRNVTNITHENKDPQIFDLGNGSCKIEFLEGRFDLLKVYNMSGMCLAQVSISQGTSSATLYHLPTHQPLLVECQSLLPNQNKTLKLLLK